MAYYSCSINVKRYGEYSSIDSVELIPGDIVEIPDTCTMPCDFLLLSG